MEGSIITIVLLLLSLGICHAETSPNFQMCDEINKESDSLNNALTIAIPKLICCLRNENKVSHMHNKIIEAFKMYQGKISEKGYFTLAKKEFLKSFFGEQIAFLNKICDISTPCDRINQRVFYVNTKASVDIPFLECCSGRNEVFRTLEDGLSQLISSMLTVKIVNKGSKESIDSVMSDIKQSMQEATEYCYRREYTCDHLNVYLQILRRELSMYTIPKANCCPRNKYFYDRNGQTILTKLKNWVNFIKNADNINDDLKHEILLYTDKEVGRTSKFC